MPKRADAIAQRLVLIACPGRIAIRLDQLQDLDAYRPFGGRPLHGRIIGIVHRRSRAEDRKSTRLKLQSLMRTSYAVFCLKKKKSQKNTLTPHQPRQTSDS